MLSDCRQYYISGHGERIHFGHDRSRFWTITKYDLNMNQISEQVIERSVLPTLCGEHLVSTDAIVSTRQRYNHRAVGLAALIAFLREVETRQKRLRKLIGKDFNSEGFVCTKGEGGVLEPDYVTSRFGRFLKSKGLPHIPFHGLRHSSASLTVLRNVGCKGRGL